MNRRDFVKTMGVGAAAVTLPGCISMETESAKYARKIGVVSKPRPEGFLWCDLVHFGANMWNDWDGTKFDAPEDQFRDNERRSIDQAPKDKFDANSPTDYLRFDYEVWKEVTQRMADRGLNSILIDVGEAIKWPRCPELAVSDSWEVDRFMKELDRLRSLGLEPIPKMNFSTCHDAWLKDYGHQISTPKYYEVCAGVIKDAYEIFGKPRFIHLGYEEEFHDKYARNDDMWWHDLHFLVGETEKLGSRAWVWTDYPVWRPREKFIEQMPKSVLQSAWWYPMMKELITCPDPVMFAKAGLFADLEKMGFDQVPCGGNYCTDKNMAEIVKMGDAVVKDGRLKGYLTTTWYPTIPKWRNRLLEAVDQVGELM